MAAGELWRCPQCTRQFANRNQWHSCLDLALEEHLAGHSQHAVELYRAFQGVVEECGEFHIHPQKSRIAFVARMSFAGATLASRWIDASFITPGPVDDPRIRQLTLYGPTTFAHTVRIATRTDLDTAVRRWLCEAWLRGTQQTLDSDARVTVVAGHARKVLTIPLASRVTAVEEELLLTMPGYAVDATGMGARVSARVPGSGPETAFVTEHGLRFASDLLRCLGLGAGDAADVFIRPA